MFRGYESLRLDIPVATTKALWTVGRALGADSTLITGAFPMSLAMKHLTPAASTGLPDPIIEFYTAKSVSEVTSMVRLMHTHGFVADVHIWSGDPQLPDDATLHEEGTLARDLGVVDVVWNACDTHTNAYRNGPLKVVSCVSARFVGDSLARYPFNIMIAPDFCVHNLRQLFESSDWDAGRIAASPPVSADDSHIMVHMSRHTRRAVKSRTARLTSYHRGPKCLREYDTLVGNAQGTTYSTHTIRNEVKTLHRVLMRGVALMRLGFSLSTEEPDQIAYEATLADIQADEALDVEKGMDRVAILAANIENTACKIQVIQGAAETFAESVAEALGENVHAPFTSHTKHLLHTLKMDLNEDRMLLAALKPRVYHTVYSCP
jgi:hypothetical protein